MLAAALLSVDMHLLLGDQEAQENPGVTAEDHDAAAIVVVTEEDGVVARTEIKSEGTGPSQVKM